MRNLQHVFSFLILIAVSLALCLSSGCAALGNATGRVANPISSPFVAPTIVPSPSQTSTQPAEHPSPTATVKATSPVINPQPVHAETCSNELTFKTDLTFPDGSKVSPGNLLDKQWQVQNSGTCDWGPGYHLQLLAGSSLGAAEQQALYPARAGKDAVLQIVFTAPSEPGSYRSAWHAIDPSGNAFGDPIYIDIQVTENP